MSGRRHCTRCSKGAAGSGFAILLPINEYEHLTQMALSSGATFLNRDGTRGAFRRRNSASALAFYKSLFDEKLAPIAGAAQISNVWNEFARGYFASIRRAVDDRRHENAASPDLQHSWATAPFPGRTGLAARRQAGRAWWSINRRATRPRRGS